MKDRQGSHRCGPVVAVLLPLVPLLYPLSLGPVVFAYNSLGQPDWMEFLEVVYAPLFEVPEPFYSMLDRYVEFWNPIVETTR